MKAFLIGAAAVVAGWALPAVSATAAPLEQPGITLISQTPYVIGSGTFDMKITVNAPDPASDRIEVRGYQQVITRTDFDSAAKGHVNSMYGYYPVVPITGQIDVPIDQAPPAGSKIPEFPVRNTGVYPFQLQLVDSAGRSVGDPLTTFLVWAASPLNRPLSVAVVVPVGSPIKLSADGQPEPLTGSESTRLNTLARYLNADSNVPAAVLTDPLTLSALESGTPTDRDTLDNLAGTPQGSLVEVLPATYSPISVSSLQGADLGADIDAQLTAGSKVLSQVYGVSPSTNTWVIQDGLDGATLSMLEAHHVTQVIVPDSDLTPLKPGFTQYTFAQPATLDDGSSHVEVLAADPGITADFAAKESPVLAANHLLAELAMIQSEQPSNTRGVAALPPPGWQPSPDFVSTLLQGLEGNPVLQAVTPSAIFSAVPPKSGLNRQLANPGGTGSGSSGLTADTKGIQNAKSEIEALRTMFPSESSASIDQLRLDLLAAESTLVSETQRHSILGAIDTAAARVKHQVKLPPAGSVTLTARRGQLPITILAAPSAKAHIELALNSQRLIFQPFNPQIGTCQIPTPTKEICTLSITAQNTTLKVPVQTRSSGLFPLDVSLYSPGGAVQLAHNRDTVRSTAVSGVGVILIVLAVVSLLLWWGRDLRHGRRARRLVPSPVAEPGEVDIVLSDDPIVHRFFADPAPEYKRDERQIG